MSVAGAGMPVSTGEGIAAVKGAMKGGGTGRGRDAFSSAKDAFSDVLQGVTSGDRRTGDAKGLKGGRPHAKDLVGDDKGSSKVGDDAGDKADGHADAAADAAAGSILVLASAVSKLRASHAHGEHSNEQPADGQADETRADETQVLAVQGQAGGTLDTADEAKAPVSRGRQDAAGHVSAAATAPAAAAPAAADMAGSAKVAASDAGNAARGPLLPEQGGADRQSFAAPLTQVGNPVEGNPAAGNPVGSKPAAGNPAAGSKHASEAGGAKIAVASETHAAPVRAPKPDPRGRHDTAASDAVEPDAMEPDVGTDLPPKETRTHRRDEASAHARRADADAGAAAKAEGSEGKPGGEPALQAPARQIARAIGQLTGGSDTRSAPGAASASTGAALSVSPLDTPTGQPQTVKVLTVALRPDALGHVTIRLRASGSEMRVEITAEQAETRDLLQRDRDTLGKLLHASGVKVDHVEIKATGTEQAFAAPAHNAGQPLPTALGTQADARAGSEQQRTQDDRGQGRSGQQAERGDEAGADARRADGGVYV